MRYVVPVLCCVEHSTIGIVLYHRLFYRNDDVLIVNFKQDPIRWKPLTDVIDGYSPTLPHLKGLQNGDTATSAIKQVCAL